MGSGSEGGVSLAIWADDKYSRAIKDSDLVMGAHDWIGNLVQNGAIDPCRSPTTPGRPSTPWPSRA